MFSVLDKLTCNSNKNTIDQILTDVNHLLNTRTTIQAVDTSELKHSLLTYGLPNLSEQNLQSSEASSFLLKSIKSALELHEPRLNNISVIVNNNIHTELSFLITATLQDEEETIEIKFDSQHQNIHVQQQAS